MSRLPDPAAGAISFQFLAEIAVGDTARVDLCRAIGGAQPGRLLAVKRLHPHVAEDPEFADMFLDEVWMTAALKHHNVVEVAGWGTDAQGAYLAVELVQGVSLARLMKTVFDTGEAFTERMVVFLGAELCAGLAAAHALTSRAGEPLMLVHRDLTPGNVLVSFGGDVKIADFGLAKAKQRVTRTVTGLLKGKPQYMSPEQAKGQPIDARADLFSLGVLLFELFAGRRPWSATSEMQMVHLTANEPPIDLRELRPKIDKELVAIVMRCLEKDPAARFQSAEEIRARLVEWLRVHGYLDGNEEALARFVRRNAMRQMRWFERAVAGELVGAPDSIRPEPPRVPSYTNETGPRHTASVSVPRVAETTTSPDTKRARVRARPSDPSRLTDVERKLAFRSEPTVQARIVEAEPGTADLDWGEEVPTLVQKKTGPVVDLKRAPRAAVPRPNVPSAIIDEDSDARTTAVRRPAGGFPAPKPRVPPVEIVDLDSAETAPRPSALPPATDDARAQEITDVHAAPPGEALPGHIAPPSPTVPAPPVRSVPPPSVGGEPVANAGVSEAVLLGEADRLAIAAVRYDEDAKAQMASAARALAMARLAADAAAIAAEAVRLATTAGTARAASRLEEARALEQRLLRGELPLETPELPRSSHAPPAPAMAAPRASFAPPAPSFAPPSVIPPPPAPPLLPAVTADAAQFAARLRPGLLGGVRREVAIAIASGGLLLLLLVAWLALR